jgi:hypothetical protein
MHYLSNLISFGGLHSEKRRMPHSHKMWSHYCRLYRQSSQTVWMDGLMEQHGKFYFKVFSDWYQMRWEAFYILNHGDCAQSNSTHCYATTCLEYGVYRLLSFIVLYSFFLPYIKYIYMVCMLVSATNILVTAALMFFNVCNSAIQ